MGKVANTIEQFPDLLGDDDDKPKQSKKGKGKGKGKKVAVV
jgi:hypothetical protein